MQQKYSLPPIFYIDLWPVADSLVCFTTPELMNQVMVTKPLPMHAGVDDFMEPMIGRNVIAAANGEVWRRLAHAMAPAFSTAHRRTLVDVYVDEILLFKEKLDTFSKTREVFSMEETSAKLIFDVIARIVFNFPLYAQTKGSGILRDLQSMIHLVEAQFSMNPVVKLGAFLKRWFTKRRLDGVIERHILERFELLRRNKIVPSRREPLSILDLMLREFVEEAAGPSETASSTSKTTTAPSSNGDGEKSTIPDITPPDLALLISNIKALLLGGHGTTTDTICFIYMLLSKNPSVLSKLRSEHAEIFSASPLKTITLLRENPQKLAELEYTDAVIKETLRLFPVGFSPRQSTTLSSTIEHDGKEYPIGHNMQIACSSHAIHYNPAYFPDPDVFDPERWLASPPPDRMLFRTFGSGPRQCMGRNLATDELKVILLMTIREYEFELDVESQFQKPNKEPKSSYTSLDTVYGDVVFQELGLEARPRGGMRMRVRKIQEKPEE
jgi:cytochrome P450